MTFERNRIPKDPSTPSEALPSKGVNWGVFIPGLKVPSHKVLGAFRGCQRSVAKNCSYLKTS